MKERVCVGGIQSDWTHVTKGVPQGSILGPLFFTIFVNDLPNMSQKCQIKKYVADTTVTCVADDHTALEMMMENDMQRIYSMGG